MVITPAQLAELVDLVEHLSTLLGWSCPQEDINKAQDRADEVVERYRSARNSDGGVTNPVQRGRELAAQAIEDEARAMEKQFGIHGPANPLGDRDMLTTRAAASSGALWEAARIARGYDNQPTSEREQLAMNLSPETIGICLQLVSGVSVPVTVPDAEAKMSALAAAHRELLAALDAPRGT